MKYWIKERENPQLGTYWVASGQMTKKRAKDIEEHSLYGCNIMHPFDTEAEYKARLANLRAAGEKVHDL